MIHRQWIQACATVSGLGVALGAFGAHGLKATVAELPDAAQRLAWWETAARYHLAHGLALGFVALLAQRGGAKARWAGISFIVGTLLFSGSLYVMALTGQRGLGAITPLGGAGFLLGWVLVGLAATALEKTGPHP
jgi:uncharacterized membrane protein YgdD (TMEM256/DUF423 family)